MTFCVKIKANLDYQTGNIGLCVGVICALTAGSVVIALLAIFIFDRVQENAELKRRFTQYFTFDSNVSALFNETDEKKTRNGKPKSLPHPDMTSQQSQHWQHHYVSEVFKDLSNLGLYRTGNLNLI